MRVVHDEAIKYIMEYEKGINLEIRLQRKSDSEGRCKKTGQRQRVGVEDCICDNTEL